MPMKTFKDRLRYLRKDVLGLSQDAFAKRIGVSRGAVANWEVGEEISLDNMSRISKTFDVSMDWLEKARGLSPERHSDSHAQNGSLDFPEGPLSKSLTPSRIEPNVSQKRAALGRERKVPIFGQAVAGVDGEFLMNGDVMFYSSVTTSAVSENAYGVRVAGVSMEPRYFDGEIVYVDPMKVAHRGDFVVVQVNMDEHSPAPWGYVKQFVRRNTRELVLTQYNPPKELIFPNDAVVSVHVVILAGMGS